MRPALTAAMTALVLGGCVEPDAGDLSDRSADTAIDVAAVEDPSAEVLTEGPFLGSKSCNDEVFSVLAGEPLSFLDTIETPDNTRILAPGSISTSDYIPQRLNVEHDDRDVITRAYCG